METEGRVGDWPKRTYYCLPSEVHETVKEARRLHMEAWREHRGLMRFLQDHYPEEFRRIQTCRMNEPWVEGAMMGPYGVRVKLSECRSVPFCPACNDASTWRRVMRTLNKVAACTPRGEEPRFIHAVQTAPVYERGEGWGIEASNDHRKFRRLVWNVLLKTYGEGIGASLTYHDFGERAFAKRAPHIDFTLNGWMVKKGRPAATAEYDRYELETWDDDVLQAARRAWPGAVTGRGNFFIRRVTEGVPSYVKAMKYQLRELVDFKKLQYDRSRGMVTWVRYSDRGPVARFSVAEFEAGLSEYARRLEPWGEHTGGRPLDGRFGHLSHRRLHTTMRIMGGTEHEDECQCQRCRDWQRIPFKDTSQEDWSDVWNE